MNSIALTNTLVKIEPLGWLAVLLALGLFRGRSTSLFQSTSSQAGNPPRQSLSYLALAVFCGLKLAEWLTYALGQQAFFSSHMSAHATDVLSTASYWAVYFLATVCAFFIMAEVLKSSLSPLPGLATAALLIFRWASILALVIALTAHLPIYGIHSLTLWLNEVDTSFTLCVCSFEVSLLFLLLRQLERLGMCLRSRPVGIALGLALIGILDLAEGVTQTIPVDLRSWVNVANELGILFAALMWVFYVVMPEPARTAHTLSPASKLMRWNEIALQFGTAGRPAESAPFISRVEATVAAILKKHNVGGYS